MRWDNFSIWRGRLPHWRADNVVYYVTFRHRRELDDQERTTIFTEVGKLDTKKIQIVILCTTPLTTEMMFRVVEAVELSDVIEPAKRRAGKRIIKKSGERFPPFYDESYDHIVRDDAEFEEMWTRILESPVDQGLAEDPGEYAQLYVQHAPE